VDEATSKILARSLRVSEDYASRLYDEIRPSTTEDGTATEDEQRGSILYRLDAPGLRARRLWARSTIFLRQESPAGFERKGLEALKAPSYH
jgi:hypothetical protein